MTAVKEKIRYIFLPFVLIGLFFIPAYTVLAWLIVHELRLFMPDESLVEYWLPMGVAWIPILVILRPRLKALKPKRSNDLFGFYFFSTFLLGFPCVFAQDYLIGLSWTSITLSHPSKVLVTKPANLYTFERYYAPQSIFFLDRATDIVSKRYGPSRFEMYAHFVLPMCDSRLDTNDIQINVWLSIPYSLNTRVPSSTQERDDFFKEFMKNVRSDFRNRNFQNIKTFERLANNAQYRASVSALSASIPRESLGDPIILTEFKPKQTNYSDTGLGWAIGIFGLGSMLMLVVILFTDINVTRLRQAVAGKKRINDELNPVLGYFTPQADYFVTPLVIDLNLLVFIVMAFSGLGIMSLRPDEALRWGAYVPSLLDEGGWWRYVTSLFVHAGLLHLGYNMFSLFFAGSILEPLVGSKRVLTVYIVSGTVGVICGGMFYPNSVTCGASGAVFGMFGSLFAMILRDIPALKQVRVTLLIILGIFSVPTILFGAFSLEVNNAAHIAGLLSGFIYGLYANSITDDPLRNLWGGRHLTGR